MTVCAARTSGHRKDELKSLKVLLWLIALPGLPGWAGAPPKCQDFSGSWQSKDPAASELRITQYGCALEGSFKLDAGGAGKRIRHKVRATASGATASGSVSRTDAGGCTTELNVSFAMERGSLVQLTSRTEGACGVPAGFTERREWKRVVALRTVLPFRCPVCGNEFGKCSGNEPGGRCVYCSSPSGNCRCPVCGAKSYEISHSHKN